MSLNDVRPDSTADDCGACAAAGIPADRRAFLRHAGLAAVAALVALGSRPADALARPLAFTASLGRTPKGHGYAIPTADGVEIDRENEVILVRWQNALYAFNLSCPHQNTALRWDEADSRFQCPKHHSQYAPDGKYLSGRATRSMDRLAITRDGSGVAVDVETMYREDRDAAAYAAAVVRLA
jgi:nitrite reductase/ring-hydroxylating ferredoxin subunit